MSTVIRFGLGCRLCQRIAAYVLASVVVAEAVILLPSIRNYERDLLHRLEHVGRLQVISAYRANAHDSTAALTLRGRLMLSPGGMVGGALYNADGRHIGSFGEAPGNPTPDRPSRERDGLRYDVAWSSAVTGLPFTVVGRLDASWIHAEVTAFIWRILGLILLLSTVVWTTTMVIVGYAVLRPLHAVRTSLARARINPAHADRYAIHAMSNDGLGEAIRDINALYARVARTYREELSAFSAMAARAEYGIVTFDALGRVTYANAACLQLCGCPSIEDLRTAGMPRIDFGDERGDIALSLSLSGGSYSQEGDLVGRSGFRTPCIVGASRISDDDASPFCFYASILDISDLRAARDRLTEQNLALASANRAKTDFLARMSHELRTPLNAVIGFSEIMAAELKGPLGAPAYRSYALDILASGRHLLGLVNDILDLARIDAASLQLNETEVNIRRLIQSVTRVGEGVAVGKDIKIFSEVAPDVPCARADELRLRQILLNLVGNAVKFSRTGDIVTVRALANGDGLELLVRDTGIGMATEDIARAMQPFTQLEGSLSRHHDGAGLGLALSDALVRLHGGHLMIDSRLGEGTTVTVTLPAYRMMACRCDGAFVSELHASGS